jgi:hypothetical protein
MKKTLFIIVILLILGMWMGINIAKNKPLFSNPFAEKDIRDRATGAAKDLLDEAKGAAKKALDDTKK